MNYMLNKYVMYDIKIYLIGIKINVLNKNIMYIEHHYRTTVL